MTMKTRKTRRARIDSIAEEVRVMSSAAKVIAPPSNVPLDACDLPFFASVVAEVAKSEWTAHQLELAAMLARMMADLNREQLALRREGTVLTSAQGTPVANPRKAAIQTHAAIVLSFRRSLSLHSRAHLGEARDAAKTRAKARQLEANNPLGDLIASRIACWPINDAGIPLGGSPSACHPLSGRRGDTAGHSPERAAPALAFCTTRLCAATHVHGICREP